MPPYEHAYYKLFAMLLQHLLKHMFLTQLRPGTGVDAQTWAHGFFGEWAFFAVKIAARQLCPKHAQQNCGSSTR
jgi:hypothetical protein